MKKLIALLLVAVMCFAFVACGGGSGNTETPPSGENTENNGGSTNGTNNQGGETNNQGGNNNGNNLEKIERGTVTTSENPLLPVLLESISDKYSYTFKEDGTCSDSEYWWIESDTEKSMAIKISTEYKWKYLIEIEIVGPFARVIPMSAIYSSDVLICFATMDKEYMIPYNIGGTHNLLSELCGEWIDSTDYCDPWSYFTIRDDGTCTVDGEEAFWMISDRYTTEDNLYIEIYNGSTHLGGIMIWGNDKVVQGVGTNFGFTQGYYEKVTN